MGRPKGTPKSGGRKKGTKNKHTVRLMEILEQENFHWAQEFVKAYTTQNFEALAILTDLIPYIAPKLAEQEVSDSEGDSAEDSSSDLNPTESSTADLVSIVKAERK